MKSVNLIIPIPFKRKHYILIAGALFIITSFLMYLYATQLVSFIALSKRKNSLAVEFEERKNLATKRDALRALEQKLTKTYDRLTKEKKSVSQLIETIACQMAQDMYLTRYTYAKNSIELVGHSRTIGSLQTLLSSLRAHEKFKDVHLKKTIQLMVDGENLIEFFVSINTQNS